MTSVPPPTGLIGRAVSESCCFDRSASDDDLDPDDQDGKVTTSWTLAHSTSGKVNSSEYNAFVSV